MIFDSSFNEGIFPEQQKVGKVSPIFKFGNIQEIGNYRTISVLPIFSKVLERIMYNRLVSISKKMTFFPQKIIQHILQF